MIILILKITYKKISLHNHFHRSAANLDDGDVAGLNVGIDSCQPVLTDS